MVVLSERPDGIRIIRVESLEEAPIPDFVYWSLPRYFSEAPYQERFRPSEAMGVLRNSLETPNRSRCWR